LKFWYSDVNCNWSLFTEVGFELSCGHSVLLEMCWVYVKWLVLLTIMQLFGRNLQRKYFEEVSDV